MPRGKQTNLDELSVKPSHVEQRILYSLAELTNKVDTLSTRVAKCDETGKEIKRSVTECLQTCQESLEVSTQNRKEVKELKI